MQNIQRKMTCSDFIMNLAKMNDGEDYPVALLKDLYYCIKTEPLSHAQQELVWGDALVFVLFLIFLTV